MAGIFKAYDVRGVYPTEIDEAIAPSDRPRFPGRPRSERSGRRQDHRGRPRHAPSSVPLAGGVGRRPARSRPRRRPRRSRHHADELLRGRPPAAPPAACRSPPATIRRSYNGLKFSQRDARPVSGDHGIPDLEKQVAAGRRCRRRARRRERGRGDAPPTASTCCVPAPGPGRRQAAQGGGRRRQRHGLSLPADPRSRRRRPRAALLRARRHLPQPRGQPAQAREPRALCARVRETGADLGVSFDGDADRAAFVDERGEPVGSDIATALIAGELLDARAGQGRASTTCARRARSPSTSRRTAASRCASASATRSSRRRCASIEGIFGGELAGHYYFRDNYHADCALARDVRDPQPAAARPASRMSELVAPLLRYAKSPEINFEVEDKAGRDRPSWRDATRTARSTTSTASRCSTRPGGSTSGRRTPSRCCGWWPRRTRRSCWRRRRRTWSGSSASRCNDKGPARSRPSPIRTRSTVSRGGRRAGRRA